jgi:hypothetical protein
MTSNVIDMKQKPWRKKSGGRFPNVRHAAIIPPHHDPGFGPNVLGRRGFF